MKYIAFILLAWLGSRAGQELYVCKNVTASLFSKAPLEDIAASSNKGTSVFNPGTGELVFSIPIRSFQFEKSLMQEHFNENYLESDKYPNATFKGKLKEKLDIAKDGSYPVTATGVLDVHGVKQNRDIDGNITVKNGVLTISSTFQVLCKDHHIDIPQIVFKKIAERIEIKVTGTYSVIKK
jgi:polyisoprenoid-binding protein YceI